MTKKADWWDYEQGTRVALPLGRCDIELLTDDGYVKAEYLCPYDELIVVTYKEGVERKIGFTSPSEIRPLDWNKNQKKPVDLSWLVDSDIDCEFVDDLNPSQTHINSLSDMIKANVRSPFKDSNGDCYEECRPRMNHPMVLTQEQLDSIPDGFLIEERRHDECTYIVTFMGLIAGYCWPWEVDCE